LAIRSLRFVFDPAEFMICKLPCAFLYNDEYDARQAQLLWRLPSSRIPVSHSNGKQECSPHAERYANVLLTLRVRIDPHAEREQYTELFVFP